MLQSVTMYDFRDAFTAYNRAKQFTYAGLTALFDYIEQLEDDIGEEIELDVIALCCDYSEYADLEAIQEDYSEIDSIDDLYESTSVIDVDGGGYIIQQF